MLNTNYLSQAKLIIAVVLFILLGCKNESTKGTSVVFKQTTKTNLVNSISEETVIKTLENNVYSLRLETRFSTDTLDIVDYKEDIYSSPIILHQKLYFLNHDKVIKDYKLPFRYIEKRTIHKNKLNALQTPIYEICLYKTKTADYYLVSGSDYCNGSECPEFTGIYAMSGQMIYEGFSTIENKTSLQEILLKYNIKLDTLAHCIKTDQY
ncbi:hypothetical protein [Xanthocytophaga flava]|uniref:hypothetical protein n=1 Tax=Xanthocytophaga flava TaxID=3048013 RepID=UPI0028D25D34|nr:hypothetical protein [Xanthocytophaga flavus]MDJ1466934.1 hypothetical protein [Xanthocytophaga flavus]